MTKTIMYASGADGQVELMTDRVIIHRRGIWNIMRSGTGARREIPLSAISSLNFRDAMVFRFGEISFVYAGRSQVDNRDDTVSFPRKRQKEFLALKEKIFELMNTKS